MRLKSAIRPVILSPARSPLDGCNGSGIPGKDFLVEYWKIVDGEVQESIGVSISDYALLSAYWQGVFFLDADIPILHTFDEWMTILLADGNINTGTTLAVEYSGFAIYQDGTDQSVLDKALAYLERRVVVPVVDNTVTYGGETVTYGGETVTYGA